MKDRKVKQVLFGGTYQWEGKGEQMRVNRSICFVYVYKNWTMHPVEIVLRSK
jgi:hypothetical protein